MTVENLGGCTNLLSVTTLCRFQRAECRPVSKITRKKPVTNPLSSVVFRTEDVAIRYDRGQQQVLLYWRPMSRNCSCDIKHGAMVTQQWRHQLTSSIYINTSYRCHRSRAVDTAREHGCYFGYPCSRDTAREHGRWTRVVCTELDSLVFDLFCCVITRSRRIHSVIHFS